MTRRRGKPSRLGGLRLLVPAAWPLLVSGLATARALAWTPLGLAPGIPLAAARLLVFALADVPAAHSGAVPH